MNTRLVFLEAKYGTEILTIEDADDPTPPPKDATVVLDAHEHTVNYIKYVYVKRGRGVPVYELEVHVFVTQK